MVTTGARVFFSHQIPANTGVPEVSAFCASRLWNIVAGQVIEGVRLGQLRLEWSPEHWGPLVALAKLCLSHEPLARPTFAAIVELTIQLETDLRNSDEDKRQALKQQAEADALGVSGIPHAALDVVSVQALPELLETKLSVVNVEIQTDLLTTTPRPLLHTEPRLLTQELETVHEAQAVSWQSNASYRENGELLVGGDD